MNTQVKVGIAAAIVAALVALIVLDQKTTPKDDPTTRTSTGGDPATIGVTNTGAEPATKRLGDEELNNLYRSAQRQFGDQPASPATTPVKGSEEPKEKRVPNTVTGEEYAIQPGDTLEKIAQKHKSSASKIVEANPGLKPTALKVGNKIIIPGKEKPVLEKKEEAPVVVAPTQDVAAPTPAPAPKQDSSSLGAKVYTVVPGDTLSGISVKVYNTSRHYQKIYEANKEAIEDPNTLQVGLKLNMPDLPAKAGNTGAPSTGAVAVVQKAAPAGSKVVEVTSGDRLWNIAAKFAAERKIGIMDMIKIIVDANVDKKIREDGSNLQAGWQLIIPE